MDTRPLGGQALEFLRGDLQQGCRLVDERAGAPGAAAIHPHIRGDEAARRLVIVEENDLGVLTAQLNGCPGPGIEGPDRGGVGHHLLYVMDAHGLRDGFSAGAAYRDAEHPLRKCRGSLLQQLPDSPRLFGMVPLIAGKQHSLCLCVQNHHLGRGGANIDPQAQGPAFFSHIVCLFHGNVREKLNDF